MENSCELSYSTANHDLRNKIVVRKKKEWLFYLHCVKIKFVLIFFYCSALLQNEFEAYKLWNTIDILYFIFIHNLRRDAKKACEYSVNSDRDSCNRAYNWGCLRTGRRRNKSNPKKEEVIGRCRWFHNKKFQRLYAYTHTVVRQPLWSSGQSFWLQIQKSGFYSWPYQIFWEVGGRERGPLSLVRTIEELLEIKRSGSGLENRD
jgi:hypothetical protein